MPPESIGRWIARLFAWLAASLALWHFGAGLLAVIQAWIAAWGANAWFPGLVSGWQREGATIDFATRLHALAGGRVGDLVFTVNGRIYSYGLAFFAALCLATDPRRWAGLLAGASGLLLLFGGSAMFDLLQQVFIANGALAARDYLPTDAERNAIALGYQASAILVPTVAPVIGWGVVHRRFLARWMAG